tara:strand:+ start:59 stop:322 length:264 start_codon:yes stop_codon:yes gene_type:complete
MAGLTPEQEQKLAMINSTEGGKNLSSSQKAVLMLKTVEIKADKPTTGMKPGGSRQQLPDATIPDLKKTGGGSVSVGSGPQTIMPKMK